MTVGTMGHQPIYHYNKPLQLQLEIPIRSALMSSINQANTAFGFDYMALAVNKRISLCNINKLVLFTLVCTYNNRKFSTN